MKTKVKILTEIEISHIRIIVNVRFGDEDMPYDFPLRKGDTWEAVVNMDTGQIMNWPAGKSGDVYLKVCDEGTYQLLGHDGFVIAQRENEYVPCDTVPGECGDYLNFKIDERGIITNWLKNPDVAVFFQDED